jgi:imidazolonepropionase-like amidohydrolase
MTRLVGNLKRLQEAGVCIAAGTDAGNIGTLHGPSFHREFELMRDAGLTPKQVLRAATIGAARVMGREAALGTLEAGKVADLLVLDADPLADVANLRRIARVVKGGVALDPKALLAEANGAAAETGGGGSGS